MRLIRRWPRPLLHNVRIELESHTNPKYMYAFTLNQHLTEFYLFFTQMPMVISPPPLIYRGRRQNITMDLLLSPTIERTVRDAKIILSAPTCIIVGENICQRTTICTVRVRSYRHRGRYLPNDNMYHRSVHPTLELQESWTFIHRHTKHYDSLTLILANMWNMLKLIDL